jgi:hypothetical protein
MINNTPNPTILLNPKNSNPDIFRVFKKTFPFNVIIHITNKFCKSFYFFCKAFGDIVLNETTETLFSVFTVSKFISIVSNKVASSCPNCYLW